MEQLCEMSNTVLLADPQGQKQLPFDSVRLNEVFDKALDMETDSLWLESRWPEEIASDVASQPVQPPTRDSPPMSMDDVLKSVDAWMAERQVPESNDAPGTTESWPQRSKRRNEDVEWDVAPHRVKFPRRNEDLGSGNPFLANWQGQTPLATGIWHNGAHNIAPHHEELVYRAAVAEPGTQTPGVAVNGVALRHPHLKFPTDNQGAAASGSHIKKILSKVSAGTSLMAARKMAYIICCRI